MDVHKNARLTPTGREIMVRRVVEGGQTPEALSAAVGVCPRTVRKWVKRFRAEGLAGLQDRSSRPHRLRGATPPQTVARIESLRRQRWTGAQIARETGVSKATVSRILRRLGLNRVRALEPAEPVRRYQREHPGELIHIDIKKLGRIDGIGHRITGDRRGQSNRRGRGEGLGWEFVHVCIDDASRIAFAQVMPDERKESATAFLKAAIAYYQSLGITVVRVMTDNGSCYKAFDFRHACRDLGLKAHPNQALHPEDQRQGRALHPERACASGPTPNPTPTPIAAPPSCRDGSIATTGTGPMVAWMHNHPSAASAYPRTTY